jgi:Na+-translocating ferredoxin:NAD+ oxidoreductase RnfG subunit
MAHPFCPIRCPTSAFVRTLVAVAAGAALVLVPRVPSARAQEGVFLQDEEVPTAVFPDADRVARLDVESTPALRERMGTRLNGSPTSIWEERYAVYAVSRGAAPLGRAVVVEEIGKHRPITFVVGLRPDGSVADVAVIAYREPYGGEVKSTRFLRQYRGKAPADPMRNGQEIKNIAGATLSVDAASRAVRKAQALVAALDETGVAQ